jgi:hypothetical protein
MEKENYDDRKLAKEIVSKAKSSIVRIINAVNELDYIISDDIEYFLDFKNKADCRISIIQHYFDQCFIVGETSIKEAVEYFIEGNVCLDSGIFEDDEGILMANSIIKELSECINLIKKHLGKT